jgi:proteasome lid subunit RPN8/RPN11
MTFFTPPDIRAFVARRSRVRMTRLQWDELAAELGRRTGGVREAGAFLLADTNQGHRPAVRKIVYFDDLDPNCLTGEISIGPTAFATLWTLCRSEGLRVIADVHTHPGTFVTQSDIDRANPMVAMAGHVALVVPHLATRAFEPRECGVHVYLGGHRWETSRDRRAARLLYVGRWA